MNFLQFKLVLKREKLTMLLTCNIIILVENVVLDPGLKQKLENGGTVVVAEGYLWEIERRGYLQFGNLLPDVVLDNPSVVRQLHEEFAHAGSDVIEAFTASSHLCFTY